MPGAPDRVVLSTALAEGRVLLTEDKDFGNLVFEAGTPSAGIILIRFPALARPLLPRAIEDLADSHGHEIATSFVVLEPNKVRISELPPLS